MAKKTIHLGLLLDESGSMAGNTQAVIDGTNEFVGSMKGVKNSDRTKVTLTTFDTALGADDVCHERWAGIPLDDAPRVTELDYVPRGGTPLNDALIKTIETMGGRMNKKDAALLMIFTDGHENSSRSSSADVKRVIEAKEEEGWSFIYLGANQDAFAETQKIGLSRVGAYSSYSSTPMGTETAFRSLATTSSAYLADGGTRRSLASTPMPENIGEEEEGA